MNLILGIFAVMKNSLRGLLFLKRDGVVSIIKSEVRRRKIREPVLCTLWGVAAGRCELCNRPLFQDPVFAQAGNFSQVAHIHAVSPAGPRHVPDMCPDEINDIKNLMLLCYDHHHVIDTTPEEFMGPELIARKQEHEARIYAVTNVSDIRKCTMVAYFNNLDSNPLEHDDELFRRAVVKAGFYPGANRCINLSDQEVDGYSPEKDFFDNQAKKLEKRFRRDFADIVREGEAIAVFALASQPLLIKLGSLINDKYFTIPFQCHREGEKWAWHSQATTVDFQIYYPESISEDKCALVIDLSAGVMNDRIIASCGKIPIIHLTIPDPNRTFVTHPKIQDDFIHKFREVMEWTKNIPSLKKILLFPIMPNSLAIRLGMDYMHKTDLPITIFEQGKPKEPFFETITIGSEDKNAKS